MMRHRLALTTAGCLLSLAGIAQGGPGADQSAASPPPPAEEVWGDPEADAEAAPGWTWFGMGYERRNRERADRTVEPRSTTTDDVGGSNGNRRNGK